MRRFFACVVLLFAFATQVAAQAPEKRVAFVLGNANYPLSLELKNPGNDATDMSNALTELGFEVLLGLDLSLDETRETLKEFEAKIADADVALFFFAGHGFQSDGQNYLLATDFETADTDEIVAKTIKLSEVLDVMATAPGIKLVFIDACRDNPLGIDEAEQGLARSGTDEADFLIAYSTQPNAVAFDGRDRNSFFTDALLLHMPTQGQPIPELMLAVRNEVYSNTGRLQIPFTESSVLRQFYFSPGKRTNSDKTQIYQIAVSLDSPSLARFYVDRYPAGEHIREARAFLEGQLPTRSLATDPNMLEDELWDVVRRVRSRRLLDLYLQEFPNGRNSLAAQSLRTLLPEDDDRSAGWRCRQLATHPNDSTRAYPGVPSSVLQNHAEEAAAICLQAFQENPSETVLLSLLARSYLVGGLRSVAVERYEQAAELGEPRALFTLALLHDPASRFSRVEDHDPVLSASLYDRAVAAGSLDAKVNRGVHLFREQAAPGDRERGLSLMEEAAGLGHGRALYNLGYFALNEEHGELSEVIDLFERATQANEANAHFALATIFDKGFPIPPDVFTAKPDPDAAAESLLRGVAEDRGEILKAFRDRTVNFSNDTIRALQARLTARGHYNGTIDGRVGPALVLSLQLWRNGGGTEI